MEKRVTVELDLIHSFLATWGEDADARWPDPYGSLHEDSEPLEIAS
jgi:hypothetical protein